MASARHNLTSSSCGRRSVGYGWGLPALSLSRSSRLARGPPLHPPFVFTFQDSSGARCQSAPPPPPKGKSRGAASHSGGGLPCTLHERHPHTEEGQGWTKDDRNPVTRPTPAQRIFPLVNSNAHRQDTPKREGAWSLSQLGSHKVIQKPPIPPPPKHPNRVKNT